MKALVVAAVVAPAVTSVTITLIQTIERLVWAVGGLHIRDLLFSLPDGLLAVIPNVLLAIVFGFCGAAVFLSLAFALADHWRRTQRACMLAGAIAGLVHLAIGFYLRELPVELKLWSWVSVSTWARIVFGFTLPGIIPHVTPIHVLELSVAWALAGVAAGYVYARMTRKP